MVMTMSSLCIALQDLSCSAHTINVCVGVCVCVFVCVLHCHSQHINHFAVTQKTTAL